MLIWILTAIAAVIFIFLFIPLTTVVKFCWDNEQRGVFIEFIPGLRLLKLEKSWNLQELERDEVSVVEETETAGGKEISSEEKHVKKGFPISQLQWLWYWWNSKSARRGFKHLRMKKLVWETSFSTGDAALTGVTTGAVWAVKGWLLGFTSSRFTLEEVQVNVWPTWDNRNLQTSFDCIVKTRLVHIIGIGITAAWYFVRYHLLAK